MTNEEAIRYFKRHIDLYCVDGISREAEEMAIKALEQQPCEMTTEEYRHRMIQAFHNADTDELIAVCVLPTEKEFEHLEWLLKNHYKKAPCVDAISRQAIDKLSKELVHTTRDKADFLCNFWEGLQQLPSVTQKYGKWIKVKSGDKDFPESIVCSRCSNENSHLDFNENAEPIGKVFVTSKFCPYCGAKMVKPQERSE